MLKIASSEETVRIPSDFKIAITAITDPQGNAQSAEAAEFYFKFYVGDSAPYIISQTENSCIENGKLFFLFHHYPFHTPGTLRYRQRTRIEDAAFAQGWQEVWDEGETPILLQ